MEWYVSAGVAAVVFLAIKYIEDRYTVGERSDRGAMLRNACIAGIAAAITEVIGGWPGGVAKPQLDALTGDPTF